MRLFSKGPKSEKDPSEVGKAAVMAKLDKALTSVFNEAGKKAVLYHMEQRYGLTFEGASSDPIQLEKAMTGLLGSIGWLVVKRRILEQFTGLDIPLQDSKSVEAWSLSDAFGFARGLLPRTDFHLSLNF